jgi:SAM-dependent methyltransferase
LERAEYERMDDVEERMWWFRALHRNLARIRQIAGQARGGFILDAGCGTGGLLAFLGKLPGKSGGDFRAGIDRDALACEFARGKTGDAISRASIDALPFSDGVFDAVFSADVLCHDGVDQQRALSEMRRCLKPGGLLVLNLPAYRWLFSAHDRAVANARRYGREDVAGLLAASGFTFIRTSYWNTLLFPLMVARRKLMSSAGGAEASDVALLPAPLEAILGGIAAAESGLLSWLLAWGLRLPFGGSILAAGMKP